MNHHKILLAGLILLFLHAIALSQAPQKLSYQAIMRNSVGELIQDQAVGLKISIIENSLEGPIVYQELFNPNPTTNENGLLTVEIGTGIPLIGTFAEINWETGNYYLKTEADPEGGTDYIISGTTQLLSVPYALYSDRAGNVFSGDYNDLSNRPSDISVFYNDIGYLTTYEESDPLFGQHIASSITNTMLNNWESAYQWGNHSVVGYAKKDMQNQTISNLADPVNAQDAVTKRYVDSLEARISDLEIIIPWWSSIEGTFIDSRNGGQEYSWVKIGNQVWMAENLDYFTAGDLSYYYSSGIDSSDYFEYGRLYNWDIAMNIELQGVCPDGWHLPSNSEWNELADYLGGVSVAGGKMKETGTTHWYDPNTDASNQSGFNGLPGGYLVSVFDPHELSYYGYYWSSTEFDSENAGAWKLNYNNGQLTYIPSANKALYYSIRCVKD